ncbi:MAG: M20/M25/M40 family metallo-hydrolase [Planctomycetaceae bacterium]|nr:M20/M25/M40 family metallo-hydrolase [Planctomycetaceae bacterium]
MSALCRTDRSAVAFRAAVILTTLVAQRSVAMEPSVARDTIVIEDLKRHVGFLASDSLEGREAGSRGGQAAATYLAHEFRQLGLTPSGDDGDFFQEFGHGYRNVLALLPGSDPEKRQEVIILGGHYDHVGYGNSSNSYGPFGQIHNGADDNASGTAAILEVAEAFSQLDTPPQRSILFALWDAEEAGLLGSAHWVKQPTFSLDRVKLAINIDMIGRLRNDRLITYGERTANGLRQSIVDANELSGLSIDFDPKHREDSDHWTFFQQNIPYLMLHTGEHPEYHRPSDDAHLLNYDGLHRVSQMMFTLTSIMGETDDLGEFREDSRRQPSHRSPRHVPPAQRPSRLGLAWEGQRRPDEPYLVTRVVANSPAAASGIRVGDRITGINGREVSPGLDLRQAVLTSVRTIRFRIARDQVTEPFEVTVQLRGQPVRLGIHWKPDPDRPRSVIVTGVITGSPAEQAGLRANDRLHPPNSSQATGPDWLQILTEAADDLITLNVDRDGQVEEVRIRLFPTPAS